MEAYFPLKLKRKDLEDVSDDFSDFSLSSPARKIRRLDAELPPIIEEECEIPVAFEDRSVGFDWSGGVKIEELPKEPSNEEEKAIVLFNPASLPRSPSSFSVSVDPRLVAAIKNQVPLSSQSDSWRPAGDEAAENNNSGSRNGCMAVIPWVPSPHFSSEPESEFPQIENYDMMDAQEAEEEEMDIEDGNIEQISVNGSGGVSLSEGFHQWQQQHCLIPQPPHNTTAPIVWYQ